jgi:hypothetical protein
VLQQSCCDVDGAGDWAAGAAKHLTWKVLTKTLKIPTIDPIYMPRDYRFGQRFASTKVARILVQD